MDESQSMDAQLMTEATPPLPTEVDGRALGCFIAVCHRRILSLGCPDMKEANMSGTGCLGLLGLAWEWWWTMRPFVSKHSHAALRGS